MPSDVPLVLYDSDSIDHRRNARIFVSKLKPVGAYWISTAYCLAVNPIVPRLQVRIETN